jgi:hypothetical protein
MRKGRWTTIVLVIGLSCFAEALAKKPDKPPGDGGEDETALFSVVELPVFTRAHSVSNPNAAGIVTVAGEGIEGGFTAATYALVDVATYEVLESGLLPEPTDAAPVDSASHARDANTDGMIVGGADVYDETANGSRRSVAVRWIPQGAGYVFELLPLPSGHTSGYVLAINEAGEMVGGSSGAVYWSADGQQVIELNSLLPEGSGWSLHTADDINSSGQVVGRGLLDEVPRGYVLDLTTLEITPVPLVSGAETNEAWQINEFGHVIGKMEGWGFYWAGHGTEPQLLPSNTNGPPIARGINNLDELAGDSHILDRNGDFEDLEMSCWLPDSGGFATEALGTSIPTKPKWHLTFGSGINDDLWICGEGIKTAKGQRSWHGVLVVPNPPAAPE